MKSIEQSELLSGLAVPLAENECAMRAFDALGEEAQNRMMHYVQGATSEVQTKQRIDHVIKSLTHAKD